MLSRDRSPVNVPLRTSSRNTNMTNMPDAMNSQDNSGYLERKTSKAQRILGTDLPLRSSHNSQLSQSSSKWEKPRSRRSSIRTPDSSRQPPNTLAPYPISNDRVTPQQNLRVRASSPLLGQEYTSPDPVPPVPKPAKKLQHSGSSSTLFSYFSSKEKKESAKSRPPTPKTPKAPKTPKGLQPRIQNELGFDPHVTYKQQTQGPPKEPKESKRKLRPPRIDLSILFPKPRNNQTQNPPLFSPQRMTSSPSPVSTVVSEFPRFDVPRMDSSRFDNANSSSMGRRVGDHPPSLNSVVQNEPPRTVNDRSDLVSIPESKSSEWTNSPFERTVGTSEIDIALDRYAGRRSLFSRSSVYTASREQLHSESQQTAEVDSHASRGLTPNYQPQTQHQFPVPPTEALPPTNVTPRRAKDRSNSYGAKSAKSGNSAITRKSSKSTLKNKNLQNTSVLCLSSSEDESEEDQDTPTAELPTFSKPKNFRDSVATYGEEPEVHTAATALAAMGHVLKVERPPSSDGRESQQTTRKNPVRHHGSQPSTSTMKTANSDRRTNKSQRASGIPTISEPGMDRYATPARTPKEIREMHRRSRMIAVTRQEQDLLEAMRQRQGKITPSILNFNPNAESDRASVLSGPSRDSFCGSDTSFLRLSAALQPLARIDQGAPLMDGSSWPSSSSDTEQKTGNSVTSSQYSTHYADSISSPATSAASPITPTLPLHRMSPLPGPKPPPRGPPPAVPDEQKQHSRRRTDSSEAIMLTDNPEDTQAKHDVQAWPFDYEWHHDQSNVAAVH